MDQNCVVFPVLHGKTEEARQYIRELDGPRRNQYDQAQHRFGNTKIVWFLVPTQDESQLVGYVESEDFARAVETFLQSQDAFDVWQRTRLEDITGLDLHNLPPGMEPELLSSYQA